MLISLDEALERIESADIVKLFGNNTFIIPQVYTEGTNGDPENEVLYVGWEEEGNVFAIKAAEGENKEVEADGHKLTFIDTEGESFELHLFREVPILF
jgi:hypothetical protein